MKIKTRTPITFYPIAITIETEKEAIRLWHILNCPDGIALTKYKEATKIQDYSVLPSELIEFKRELWKGFNKLFHPEEVG